ncbi:MAG: dihydroneopterin triphosphate diphosphatase [Azonexus sp.]|nr:dihydroneopterin triphosphate diphosphatase [Azonexus sp.]MCK6411389.1 dihydroneopterin triphosphate diphosphatase [Azonexus sp.]
MNTESGRALPAYKQPISVLVVIHTPTLDILLLERAAHPGYWQSVTGSRENDESPRLTAQREVLEETGIDCRQHLLLDWQQQNRYEIYPQWRHRYAPGITENVEHVFSLCLPERREVRIAPDEHRDYRWLPWREAAECCFSASNRDAIEALPSRS